MHRHGGQAYVPSCGPMEARATVPLLIQINSRFASVTLEIVRSGHLVLGSFFTARNVFIHVGSRSIFSTNSEC